MVESRSSWEVMTDTKSATWISLPYGGHGAGFDAVDLENYLLERGLDYIVQGHCKCVLGDHRKPNSLDYWLRQRYTEYKDTMQAVDSVIRELVGTGIFCRGSFICPDSGQRCKGIALLRLRLSGKP